MVWQFLSDLSNFILGSGYMTRHTWKGQVFANDFNMGECESQFVSLHYVNKVTDSLLRS